MNRSFLCLAAVALLAAAPAVAETVTGKVANSTGTASAGTSSARARGSAAGSTAAAGTVVSFQIDSLTSDEQVEQLKAATDLRSFLDTLAGFRAGSVTVRGEGSVTINAAFKDSAGDYVLLSASDMRSLVGSTSSAASRSVGMARLMPSRAEGWIASTTQAVAWSGDTPVARAGGSQATSLVEVAAQ
jgi:hypothetical protein